MEGGSRESDWACRGAAGRAPAPAMAERKRCDDGVGRMERQVPDWGWGKGEQACVWGGALPRSGTPGHVLKTGKGLSGPPGGREGCSARRKTFLGSTAPSHREAAAGRDAGHLDAQHAHDAPAPRGEADDDAGATDAAEHPGLDCALLADLWG
jgi:hypothetical protein